MEVKQNQTFFCGIYSNLTPYVLYKKIWKYFNDFRNRNISVFWLHWTQTMEMKQSQVYFHGIFSNLTSFLIGHKIIKYLNDWRKWHISISSQKWIQVYWNEIKRDMCKSDSIFPDLQRGTLFKWLLKFISW